MRRERARLRSMRKRTASSCGDGRAPAAAAQLSAVRTPRAHTEHAHTPPAAARAPSLRAPRLVQVARRRPPQLLQQLRVLRLRRRELLQARLHAVELLPDARVAELLRGHPTDMGSRTRGERRAGFGRADRHEPGRPRSEALRDGERWPGARHTTRASNPHSPRRFPRRGGRPPRKASSRPTTRGPCRRARAPCPPRQTRRQRRSLRGGENGGESAGVGSPKRRAPAEKGAGGNWRDGADAGARARAVVAGGAVVRAGDLLACGTGGGGERHTLTPGAAKARLPLSSSSEAAGALRARGPGRRGREARALLDGRRRVELENSLPALGRNPLPLAVPLRGVVDHVQRGDEPLRERGGGSRDVRRLGRGGERRPGRHVLPAGARQISAGVRACGLGGGPSSARSSRQSRRSGWRRGRRNSRTCPE